MVDISDISLLDVLPQNLAQNPDVIAMSKAIDDELHAINKLIPKTTIYGLIDGLESAVLDHLAWQWNSDTWRDNWPVSLKRSVFKSIIRTKRIKGTRAAVEDVVSSLGGVVDIKEWFEQSPRGEPYTASIVASINSFDGAVPSKEMLDDVIRSIKYAKSARTLYSFSQAANISSSIGIAGGLQSVSYVRLTGEG
ncbi:phage tail protein I [Salmonella enterica]|uniref:Phage tail protein I n=3 Tax=Salmonella enterica TaxID=28901 RepID=A0A8E7U9Z3_SALER|nr:phage tail protein I [Salmonella enterica]EAB7708015.1 phage tail protein I [Salmonella enterica subsp. enterica serovar Javiana]EAB8937463.1 phage tail protein I [Salmonella enterica subsp. enterica serovar Bonariensis]EAM3805165.1 phage tail protein I [Salmonella enterica subsp. enterica serovar Hartford]EBU9580102.1 phage tail protein I [Salmonella enterica subsp. enterica serovar Gatuni]ECD9474762.1 phage tail protein I [Salmonella enterica subsp. houtenae]ECE9707654.1 phage tail prote